MNKIKIAFVGTGYMANEHAKVLTREFRDKIQLVGAINRSKNNIKKFIKKYKILNQYTSLEKMMETSKPDIVIVCVNELSTLKILNILSNYNCKCLVEKPIGLNFDQSKKILKFYKNKKFLPIIALNRRYYSSVSNTQKIISNDKSPRIIRIFDQENPLIAKKLGKPIQVVKNWMYANSIHMVDFAYQFGRGKIKYVKKLNDINILKEGNISSVLYFDSGDIVYYNCIWNRPAPWCVEISTKEYFVQLKPIEKMSFITKKNRNWTPVKISKFDVKYKAGIYSLLTNLIKYKKSKLKDLNYSHKLMQLIKRIYFD
ncbi:Gfo/Idh/MocA family oxidoreductase [Candidatus Pelagibacter sp.]|nr:Gfo/Idh/MocA family oxidoreductase [Candidatus Pelagibacter sp.]